MRSEFLNFVFVFLLAVVTILGCAEPQFCKCKPMLFPYDEYGYKAKTVRLGTFFNKNDAIQNIELFNLKLSVPEGWTFEEVFKKTCVFRFEGGQNFLFSLDTDRPFSNEIKEINLLGCENFKKITPTSIKTQRERITDMFLFTNYQINNESTFWHYSVLWSKSNILRDAVALFHYNGDHLEAFQRNIDPNRMIGDIQTHIVIFPNKFKSEYITIASNFTDDIFFSKFVDMLDTLNP